jgi:formylglycine-generating enzyme required for sulfatase activity
MDDNPSQFKYGPEFPVESVSWHDIHIFIEKLNDRERGVRYRLPTEAEWEYAARGRDGRTYPWSNQFDGTRLNFCDRNCEYKGMRDTSTNDNYATTAPVGIYSNGQNAFGTYDMAGNVWEWVQDWYDHTAYQRRATAGVTAVDPFGLTRGSNRVVRGGSWSGVAWYCRSADRGLADPSHRFDSLGFRLLREVS